RPDVVRHLEALPPATEKPCLHPRESTDREVWVKNRFTQTKERHACGKPVECGTDAEAHGQHAEELAERLKRCWRFERRVQACHRAGDLLRPGDGDAPGATRDVLSPPKTENAGVSDGPEELAIAAAAHRLRGILDYEGAPIRAETHDPIHVGRNAKEVSRNDAEGVAVDGPREQIMVEIERLRIDVTQSDAEAGTHDGRGHGKACVGGDHDLPSG